MLQDSYAFSGFSVNDLTTAKEFYSTLLGLTVEQEEMGLTIKLKGGGSVFVYQKDDHTPASYTVLNFPVEDIDKAVQELKTKGIDFVHYDGMTDEHGIARGRAHNMGPDIAWFKDPAGNFFSVLQ